MILYLYSNSYGPHLSRGRCPGLSGGLLAMGQGAVAGGSGLYDLSMWLYDLL